MFTLLMPKLDRPALRLVYYFARTYVQFAGVANANAQQQTGQRGRPRRTPATFPPPVWNCFDRFNNELATTNNAVEAWHQRLSHLIPRRRPRLWAFLEKMKQEQQRTESEVVRFEAGDSANPKRRSVTVRADRLHRIIREARGVYDLRYLRRVAHNFSF